MVFIAFNTDPSPLNGKRTKDKMIIELKMTKSAGCFSLHSFSTHGAFYAKKIVGVEFKGLTWQSRAGHKVYKLENVSYHLFF